MNSTQPTTPTTPGTGDAGVHVTSRSTMKLLRAAAYLALVALVLMAWAVLMPRPIPIMAWMSLGQLLGTVALVLLGVAIVRDRRPRGPRTSFGHHLRHGSHYR
jgi:hypothetical protein